MQVIKSWSELFVLHCQVTRVYWRLCRTPLRWGSARVQLSTWSTLPSSAALLAPACSSPFSISKRSSTHSVKRALFSILALGLSSCIFSTLVIILLTWCLSAALDQVPREQGPYLTRPWIPRVGPGSRSICSTNRKKHEWKEYRNDPWFQRGTLSVFPMPSVSSSVQAKYQMPGLEDRAPGQALCRMLPSF